MIRVGVLVDVLRHQHRRTGIGRYTLNLLRHLSARTDVEMVPINSDEDIDPDSLGIPNLLTLDREHRTGNLLKLWRYPSDLKKLGLDVLHWPGQFPKRYFVAAGGCKVLTVHDIAPLLYGDEMHPRLSFVKRASVAFLPRVADLLIADSQSTKEGLIERCGAHPEAVEVIPLGVEHERFKPSDDRTIAEARSKFGLVAPYLLHVSNYRPLKNLVRIIEAFMRVWEAGSKDIELVIAGGGGWRYEEFLRWVEPYRAKGGIRMIGQVEEEWLPALYSGAELFVFPSLYEGFGLPVLEAMACGTPVLTSGVSSLPEVAGDAAILVDPTDVEAIADGMRRILGDQRLRTELRRRGLERASRFTWDVCARRHFEAYQTLRAAA